MPSITLPSSVTWHKCLPARTTRGHSLWTPEQLLPPQWAHLGKHTAVPATAGTALRDVAIALHQNLLWVLGVLGVIGGGLSGVDCCSEEPWSSVSLLSPNWRLFGLCAFPDVPWLKQRVNKPFRSQQGCCTHMGWSGLSQRHQRDPEKPHTREKGAFRWNRRVKALRWLSHVKRHTPCSQDTSSFRWTLPAGQQ